MGRVGVRSRDRVDAALELLTLMRPHAVGIGFPIATIFEHEPGTAKMLAEKAGLASLAARREMEEGEVLEAVGFLIDVGKALTAEV
jgi:hypothetical protein